MESQPLKSLTPAFTDMIDPRKVNKIVGPPGTGKTTELLRIVDELLSLGQDPSKICFVAFTRRAANEAKSRALSKFNLTHHDLPLFRTLHSLAFQQLGLNRSSVMGVRDYIEIAKELGLYLTIKGVQEDGTIIGLSKGDRLLFMEMMSRARLMTLHDYWEKFPNEDIYFYELDRLSKYIHQYKQSYNKIDFIDMIEQFCEEQPIPDHEVLIVDEAQDLSPLQWKMVSTISSKSTDVHVAGDDDQAIFTWAGADVNAFIELEGNTRVLEKSYRCPGKVFNVAIEISSRIQTRIDKTYLPREEAGEVEFVTALEQVDMSTGTWLLLARNVYLLEQLNQHCIESGYVFDSPLGSPAKGATLRAIINWENLRKGLSISIGEVSEIYDLMTVRVGVAYGFKAKLEKEPEGRAISLPELQSELGLLTDKIWHEALDKIAPIEREYFLAALRQGEKLKKEPRIRISTIHGAKGAEADNVLIVTDMAARTYLEAQQDPDNEHRVWYVAVTRARNKLVILQPVTNKNYVI